MMRKNKVSAKLIESQLFIVWQETQLFVRFNIWYILKLKNYMWKNISEVF